MAIVNFRVDEETKRRMEKLRHLNWSELLRTYVEEVVSAEEKRLPVERDRSLVEEGVREIEELRSRSPEDWSRAEVVIEWRRARR